MDSLGCLPSSNVLGRLRDGSLASCQASSLDRFREQKASRLPSCRNLCCSSLCYANAVELRTPAPSGISAMADMPSRRMFSPRPLRKLGAFSLERNSSSLWTCSCEFLPSSILKKGGRRPRSLRKISAHSGTSPGDVEGPPTPSFVVGPGVSSFPREERMGFLEHDGPSSIIIFNDGHPSCLLALQTPMAKAFSSMVLMLKALHSYALEMRSQLYYEDVESVCDVIHREMQASFLWLFQQVFSCTPVLMVSVMLLFSDFTAFSASSNFVSSDLRQSPISSAMRSLPLKTSLVEAGSSDGSFSFPLEAGSSFSPRTGFGGDDDSHSVLGYLPLPGLQDESRWTSTNTSPLLGLPVAGPLSSSLLASEADSMDQALVENTEDEGLSTLFNSTVEEMELKSGCAMSHLRLDHQTVRQLVAPVSVELETDNYACFDRTDLQYQESIQDDEHNPLLLSNYAQFLYVVRKDYDRAEAYFHKALREDPTDGDILGRFAMFLWLARKDKDAAERAYKAALAASPNNPYYTGSYAHFLWHGGEDETTCSLA